MLFRSAVNEMERRYTLMAEEKVKNIVDYNAKVERGEVKGGGDEEWKGMSGEVLTPDEVGMVEDKMFSPLMSSLPEDVIIQSTFTILRRDDDMRAVILRYISKEDYIGTNENIAEVDEDDGEFEPDVCIRSVFLGAHRLMIVISGNNEMKGIVENEG